MKSRVAAAVAACMLGLGFAGIATAAPEGTLIDAAENEQHDEALKLLAGGADAKARRRRHDGPATGPRTSVTWIWRTSSSALARTSTR